MFACTQADEEAALSDDVAESLLQTMLQRLRDTQPAVRCQAALALARLADPGEVRRQLSQDLDSPGMIAQAAAGWLTI